MSAWLGQPGIGYDAEIARFKVGEIRRRHRLPGHLPADGFPGGVQAVAVRPIRPAGTIAPRLHPDRQGAPGAREDHRLAAGLDSAPWTPPPIQYARTEDGVNIAYAQVGTGPPLVRSLGWFTHLEMEWGSAPGRYFWQELARRYRVIRFDGRGMGLSDREVAEFSLDARLRDLEAVIEATCDTTPIVMGLSEGCAAAVAYAARRPERVASLVSANSLCHAVGV